MLAISHQAQSGTGIATQSHHALSWRTGPAIASDGIVQVDVLAATDNPILIEPMAMSQLSQWGDPENGPHGGQVWPALLRRLAREHPDYAD